MLRVNSYVQSCWNNIDEGAYQKVVLTELMIIDLFDAQSEKKLFQLNAGVW